MRNDSGEMIATEGMTMTRTVIIGDEITTTMDMIVITPPNMTKGRMINDIRSDGSTPNTINVTPTDKDIGIIGATTEEKISEGTSVGELLLHGRRN